MRDRRRRSAEIADRADARIQIEDLPQRHVEASNTATDRRGQWTFDRDLVRLHRLERIVREPFARRRFRFLAGEDLEPREPALAAVGFCDSRIEHAHAGAPDVRTRAVAFDERHDRILRHDEASVFARDRSTARRRLERSEIWHHPVSAPAISYQAERSAT